MSQTVSRPILIVEDSDEDFEAAIWALEKAAVAVPVVRCKDGEQAIDYLENARLDAPVDGAPFPATDAPLFPAIVFLDLNLPRSDGNHVLTHMKASRRLKSLPVIVITTSKLRRDVQTCYRLGANSFIVKPVSMVKLRELMAVLAEYWFSLVVLPEPESSDGD
jgi:CheY-like chemotaxis protein